VDRRIKSELLQHLQQAIQGFYGADPATSPDYGRIIHHRPFDRLLGFLDRGKIVVGGHSDRNSRYIAPTILEQVSWEDPVMQEEIFGPILPVLEYSNLEDALAQVNQRPKPLALYFFSQDQAQQQRVLQATSSGSVCLNDTVMQVGVWGLPFGGVGDSGIGRYHGKASFETFSHYKSVLRRSFWLDLGWRYAPYTRQRLEQIKRIVTG
jgi:aldehyde dehydrogenase (NAD+)